LTLEEIPPPPPPLFWVPLLAWGAGGGRGKKNAAKGKFFPLPPTPRPLAPGENTPPPPMLVVGPIVDLEAVVVKRKRFCTYCKALVHYLVLLGYLRVSYKHGEDLL